MTIAFVLLAGLMLLGALAFVLPPLLRHGRTGAPPAARRRALDDALAAGVITAEEHLAKLAALEQQVSVKGTAPRTRSAFNSALGTLLLLPALAIGLYLHLGNVRAMDPAATAAAAAASGTPGPDMDAAVKGLVDKLAKNPDDIEGWMLLGRAYKSMERFPEARDALKNAYDRAKDNPDVQVDYAEALALSGEGRRIDGRARELLDAAIKTDPNHQRALWLLGIADYQQQNYAAAAARWEQLRALMPPESDARGSLDRQIADARQRGGLDASAPTTPPSPVPAAPAAATAGDPAASAGPQLTVEVSLDPTLRDKVPASASVFVFARAANGPPMPLAVQRLTMADLPAKVVLTEAMSMMPTMKLSQFPQVVVGARISASGNAKAQSGDLQKLSAPLDVASKTPVVLVIDQVVP
ncbi:cytochrome C biogenesis protein [Tahibacter sp.]|uniref:tetratricopeptide repeat protein n=1 Tax=Tahibacter sp. TaxID=2056211 RepID=UPI0028C3BA2C|nr:cytochrome C biogenesis protein [Tahibacter sp.]